MSKTIDAVVVETDGRVTPVTLEHNGTSHADALNREVGGWFDHVNLGPDLDMWVHDTGAYELQPNPYATVICEKHGRNVAIFGRAVFTGGVDGEGDTLAINPEYAETIRQMIGLINTHGEVYTKQVAARIHVWACDALGRDPGLTPLTITGWTA